MVAKRLQYRYDAVGNKVGMTDADGGLFTYTYDVMRQLTGVINSLGERTTYVYDLNGRRTSVQLANGTRTSYSYDQGSHVQQIHTLKSNNSTVAKFDYAYDDNGRRTSVLEADGSRVTWTYDGTSQVTSEWRTGTSPFRHTFVYDTRGNRTLKIEDGARTTLVYDAANQLSSSQDVSGTTNYTYDANGNQHVTATPGGSRTTQIWDYENRLVKTLQPGGGVFTMAYDADGLRVRKETPSETKLFVWDDQNYLTETDDSGITEVAYTTEPSTYGSTISHRSGGATTTYHFDALAATRALTNTSETVLESYNYTAFGTILGTPTLLTPFLWGGMVGYYWDADLATQYIRARHYQPSIARWISIDPIGFAGGDTNLFRYVGNSPTSGATQRLRMLNEARRITYSNAMSRLVLYHDLPDKSYIMFVSTIIPRVRFHNSGIETNRVSLSSFQRLASIDPSGLEGEQPENEEVSFEVCSSPVKGAGHLFIILNGVAYRAGPSGKGQEKKECPCYNDAYGQLLATSAPWDKTNVDHPDNKEKGYPKGQLKCRTVTVMVNAGTLSQCFDSMKEQLRDCCIPYDPIPVKGIADGNSNSYIAWLMERCAGLSSTKEWIPDDNRLSPGTFQSLPKCFK